MVIPVDEYCFKPGAIPRSPMLSSCWLCDSVYAVLSVFCLRFPPATQGRPVCASMFGKIACVRKTPAVQIRTCSTPALSRLLLRKWICLHPSMPSWSETQRAARKRSIIHKKSTCVCLRLPVSASCSEAQERKGYLWLALLLVWNESEYIINLANNVMAEMWFFLLSHEN